MQTSNYHSTPSEFFKLELSGGIDSCLPISNSSSPLTKTLGTVPSQPIITGVTVTNMVLYFCNSLARSKYLSLFSISFIFTGKVKPTIRQVLFLFIITRSTLLVEIWRSVWISKIPENFVRLIPQNKFWFVHVTFGSLIKFQFFTQFPVDLLSYSLTHSYLDLYSFFACFLHSLIMYVIASSLSPYNLHCYFVTCYRFSL